MKKKKKRPGRRAPESTDREADAQPAAAARAAAEHGCAGGCDQDGRARGRPVRVVFFQAEHGIRDYKVTGVQTCALPICRDQSAHAELGSESLPGFEGLSP